MSSISVGSDALGNKLESCFGVPTLEELDFELLKTRDLTFAECLENSGLISEVPRGFFSGTRVESPCGPDPSDPSAACCTAIDLALECERSDATLISDECKDLFDKVLLETYECSSVLSPYIWLIILVGLLFLFSLVLAVCFRHKPFGALLRKNFLIWKQSWIRNLVGQVFEVAIVGVLAFLLLYFTGMQVEYLFIEFLGTDIEIETPDSNRALIYQNLRPFGGLFFLIVFTYPVASITVSIVNEKETRMKEAMRMAGMSDWPLIVSWILTFLCVFTPLVLGVAFLTHFGAIFPNQPVSQIAFFFFTLLFALVGLSFLVAVFFTSTRPAAIASICFTYLLFFSSFHFLNLPTKEEQIKGCILAPVCLALGINTMLDDSSLGTGFARSAALVTTDRENLMIQVDTCSWWLILDAILYLVFAWYLDQVVPQRYGVRKRVDFFLQPIYPYVKPVLEKWLEKCLSKTRDTRFIAQQKEVPSAHDSAESESASSSQENDSLDDIEQNAMDADKIVLKDLSKHYRINGLLEKRKAVDHLNAVFERNQITVLLGPNGAGKSTTFSMLTGLIEPTAGDVTVFGKSVRTQMNEIRKSMGYVPQHDILYPMLTVRQHLELFSALRGNRLDIDAMNEMLKELGILEKLHVKARALSGGQKRKLCLSMALIGNTDVVYLDEVSSGVDPNSRRSIWNVLQNNRKGRAIIITTHFMDEAEMLGDKIAIIANGKLCAEGTALQLKRQFGSGYRLVVSDRKGGLPKSPSAVRDFILSSCPGAEHVRTRTEMEFTLPFNQTQTFPQLLDGLEATFRCRINIQVSGLEEVFLRVAEDFANDSIDLEGLQSTPPYIEHNKPRRRPIGALLRKRVNYAMRDYKACMLVFLLPILFSLGLVLIPEIELYNLIFPSQGEATPRNLECEATLSGPGVYPWANTNSFPAQLTPLITQGRTCCPPPSENAGVTTQANFERCVEKLPQCLDLTIEFATQLVQNCKVFQYYYCYANPWLCKVEECCDPTNYKSPFYVCQGKVGFENSNIFDMGNGNFNNFCGVRDISVAQEYVNSFIRSLVILLAFLFGSGSVIAFAVMEKEEHRDTKFQQIVNGVSKTVFWFSSFLFDQVVLLLPLVIFPLFVVAAPESSINYDMSIILQTVVLVACFLIVSVPMAYAFSFSYKMHARALIGIIIFNLITGAALACLSYVLEVVPINIGDSDFNTQTLMGDYVRYILSIFPAFALADGLLRLQTQEVKVCGSWANFESLAMCTDLLPASSVEQGDYDDFSIRFALFDFFEANPYGTLGARFVSNWDATLVSGGYMLGMTVVFWIYIAFRESSLRSLCRCCLVDRKARAHQRRAEKATATTQVPLAPQASFLLDDDELAEFAELAEVAESTEASASFRKRLEVYQRTLKRQESSTLNMFEKGKIDVQQEKQRVESQQDDILQILGLRKVYPKKIALDGLYLGIRPGEVLGYLGVNGAGKSTTIKMLTGYERPTDGTAIVDGNSILTQMSKVRSKLGYCSQFDALFDLLTVQEHLQMYARIRGLSDISKAVESSIKRLNLTKFRHVIASQLSGGNKRKLSAAIAMLGGPKVIILDEPSSGVDPSSQRFLWEVITSTAKETESAVLLVSHSLPEVSFCCDRISVLIGGKLRAIGTEHHLQTLYSAGYRVEVGLSNNYPMLDQPELVEHALGLVTIDILDDVCRALGRPERAAALSSKGEYASSSVAFALNTASIGSCTWDHFSKWWVEQDMVERLELFLKEQWDHSKVDLTDRQSSRLIFSVANPNLRVSTMFNLLNEIQQDFCIEYFAVSSSSLEEIFNRWVVAVDEQDE